MNRRTKIMVFLTSLLLVHVLLVIAFGFASKRKNELLKRFNNYKKLEELELLFAGDSHVERSVDASLISNAFSLAYYGENNVMCYYRLKYIFENNLPKPKYLVLPCDLTTFSKGFNNYRTNRFFYYKYIPFSELKKFEQDLPAGEYNFIRTKLFPYAEWQYGLNIYNANRQAKGKKQFSDLSVAEQKNNASNFIQNELYCAQGKENLFYPGALEYLSKTIELCKKNNVKLIFVNFPTSKSVLDEVAEHVDVEYIRKRPAEDLVRNAGLPFLYFENEFIGKDYLFFDCHHLNDSGKVVFMPLLKEKLDSLLKVY